MADQAIGTVSSVTGEVVATNKATGEERTLQAGDELFATDVVQTGKGSLAIFDFVDGSKKGMASEATFDLAGVQIADDAAGGDPTPEQIDAEMTAEPAAAGGEPAVQVGTLTAAAGEITATGPDGSERQLAEGDALFAGDTIVSGNSSTGIIQYSDGSSAGLSSNAQVTLEAPRGTESAEMAAEAVGATAPDAAVEEAQAEQVALGTGIPVGTVSAASGPVIARGPDGSERKLQAGDELNADEVVETGQNATAIFKFYDGSTKGLASNASVTLNEKSLDLAAIKAARGDDPQAEPEGAVTEVVPVQGGVKPIAVAKVAQEFAPGAVKTVEALDEDVAAIQAAIEEGADPSEEAEATAAGEQGSEGGHSAVFLDRSAQRGDVGPGDGFNTDLLSAEVISALRGEDALLTSFAIGGGGEGEGGGGILVPIIDLIKLIGDTILELAEELLKLVADTIRQLGEELASFLENLDLSELVEGLLGIVGNLVNGLIDIVQNFLTDIGEVLGAVLETVFEVFEGVLGLVESLTGIDLFDNPLTEILEGGFQMFVSNLPPQFTDGFRELTGQEFPTTFLEGYNALKGAVLGVGDLGQEGIATVNEEVLENFQALFNEYYGTPGSDEEAGSGFAGEVAGGVRAVEDGIDDGSGGQYEEGRQQLADATTSNLAEPTRTVTDGTADVLESIVPTIREYGYEDTFDVLYAAARAGDSGLATQTMPSGAETQAALMELVSNYADQDSMSSPVLTESPTSLAVQSMFAQLAESGGGEGDDQSSEPQPAPQEQLADALPLGTPSLELPGAPELNSPQEGASQGDSQSAPLPLTEPTGTVPTGTDSATSDASAAPVVTDVSLAQSQGPFTALVGAAGDLADAVLPGQDQPEDTPPEERTEPTEPPPRPGDAPQRADYPAGRDGDAQYNQAAAEYNQQVEDYNWYHGGVEPRREGETQEQYNARAQEEFDASHRPQESDPNAPPHPGEPPERPGEPPEQPQREDYPSDEEYREAVARYNEEAEAYNAEVGQYNEEAEAYNERAEAWNAYQEQRQQEYEQQQAERDADEQPEPSAEQPSGAESGTPITAGISEGSIDPQIDEGGVRQEPFLAEVNVANPGGGTTTIEADPGIYLDTDDSDGSRGAGVSEAPLGVRQPVRGDDGNFNDVRVTGQSPSVYADSQQGITVGEPRGFGETVDGEQQGGLGGRVQNPTQYGPEETRDNSFYTEQQTFGPSDEPSPVDPLVNAVAKLIGDLVADFAPDGSEAEPVVQSAQAFQAGMVGVLQGLASDVEGAGSLGATLASQLETLAGTISEAGPPEGGDPSSTETALRAMQTRFDEEGPSQALFQEGLASVFRAIGEDAVARSQQTDENDPDAPAQDTAATPVAKLFAGVMNTFESVTLNGLAEGQSYAAGLPGYLSEGADRESYDPAYAPLVSALRAAVLHTFGDEVLKPAIELLKTGGHLATADEKVFGENADATLAVPDPSPVAVGSVTEQLADVAESLPEGDDDEEVTTVSTKTIVYNDDGTVQSESTETRVEEQDGDEQALGFAEAGLRGGVIAALEELAEFFTNEPQGQRDVQRSETNEVNKPPSAPPPPPENTYEAGKAFLVGLSARSQAKSSADLGTLLEFMGQDLESSYYGERAGLSGLEQGGSADQDAEPLREYGGGPGNAYDDGYAAARAAATPLQDGKVANPAVFARSEAANAADDGAGMAAESPQAGEQAAANMKLLAKFLRPGEAPERDEDGNPKRDDEGRTSFRTGMQAEGAMLALLIAVMIADPEAVQAAMNDLSTAVQADVQAIQDAQPEGEQRDPPPTPDSAEAISKFLTGLQTLGEDAGAPPEEGEAYEPEGGPDKSQAELADVFLALSRDVDAYNAYFQANEPGGLSVSGTVADGLDGLANQAPGNEEGLAGFFAMIGNALQPEYSVPYENKTPQAVESFLTGLEEQDAGASRAELGDVFHALARDVEQREGEYPPLFSTRLDFAGDLVSGRITSGTEASLGTLLQAGDPLVQVDAKHADNLADVVEAMGTVSESFQEGNPFAEGMTNLANGIRAIASNDGTEEGAETISSNDLVAALSFPPAAQEPNPDYQPEEGGVTGISRAIDLGGLQDPAAGMSSARSDGGFENPLNVSSSRSTASTPEAEDVQELPGFLNQDGAGSGGVSPALALPTGIAGVTDGQVINSVGGNTSEDGSEVVFIAPAEHDSMVFDIDHAEASEVKVENFHPEQGDQLGIGELLNGEGFQEGESLNDYLKADENENGDAVLHLGHADEAGNFVESTKITLQGVSMQGATSEDYVEALSLAGSLALPGSDAGSSLLSGGSNDTLGF